MRTDGGHPAPRAAASRFLWVLPAMFLAGSALLSMNLREGGASAGPAADPGGAGGGLLLAISRSPGYAFGFRSFLADLQWLEAVQVAGSRRMKDRDYDRLDRLLRAVNNFDPRFVVPYLLGGLILGDSPRHVPEALQVLERGARAFPADWRFPFYIGYTRYFSLGDPVEGGKAIEWAARIPDSPPYLPLLASRMFSEGRKPETAIAFLKELMNQETDPERKEILRRRMLQVIAERDLQELERAVDAYGNRFGGPPKELSDLVSAGLVSRIPGEPHGGSYLLGPDGGVRSDRLERRLRVFRKK